MADRLLSALTSLIQGIVGNAIVGPRVDYLAAYQCVAVSQNGDGTLELVPDDKRIPGLSKVPIRYGVPGVSATVAAGARVLLEFAGGDPQKPIATVWESASVTVLTATATTVKLGGSGASQALVLGGQYQTHMTSLQTALSNLSTALNALGAAMTPLLLPPAAAAAKAAAVLAVTAATAAQTAAGNLAADISSNSFTT